MPSASEPLPARKSRPADAMSGAQRTANAPARPVERAQGAVERAHGARERAHGARVYPESDGEPVAETDIHYRAIVDAWSILRARYADRDDVYIGGNLFVYYVEGNRDIKFSPDVFVAFGPSREPPRRVWKTWEEGKFADFALEVAWKGTHGADEVRKRRLYERLGVTEYWQHDPTGDYIDPLKGHRLNDRGIYERVPIAATPEGMPCGESNVLGLRLCLDEGRLRLFDPATGEFLLNHAEHARASAAKDDTIAGQRQTIAEERQTIAEERRARQAAEAELVELKRQLARRS